MSAVSPHPPHDPRAIANLILDEADREGIQISSMALQKLIYFAHGLYLTQTKKPLVSGHFEAWQYGPVHPSTYRAFKDSGSLPITTRAQGKDPLTGRSMPLRKVEDEKVIDLLRRVVMSLGAMSTGDLIDLSQAKEAPWDYVVEKQKAAVVLGLRISNAVIEARFKNHKMLLVGDKPVPPKGYADTPLV